MKRIAFAVPLISALTATVALAQPAEQVLGVGIGSLIDQGVMGVAVVVLGLAVWRLFQLLQLKDAASMSVAMKVTEVLPAFTAELRALREELQRRGPPGFGGPGTNGGGE